MEINMIIEIHKAYTLGQLINFTYNEAANDPSESQLDGKSLFIHYDGATTSNKEVYLENIDFDKNINNDEGYSEFIDGNDLDILCTGATFVAVISSYKDYKNELNIDLVLKALDYYLDNDNFMEID